MADDVVWGDEPPTKTTAARPRKWAHVLSQYKEHPGKWGRLREAYPKRQAYSLSTRINTGKLAGIEEGEFEAMARQRGTEHFVWVRYVGQE